MARLDGVQEFVAVVEAGSFTAGAGRLGISKSSISSRVSALESRLGTRLLLRSTRRLSLTDAGSIYFERCASLVAQAQAAEDALRARHDVPNGRLRISCTADFGSDHLAPLLPEFLATFPQVIPELVVRDEFVDLAREKIDVAIRFTPLDNPDMVVRRLGRLWGHALASAAYVARHGRLSQPEELARHRCLLFTPYPWGREWRFINAAGERRRVVVPETAWISQGATLRSATLAGAGIALFATPLAGHFIRTGELINVLPGWMPDTDELVARTICAVFPDNRNIPAKTRAFVDFLAQRIGDPPYWDAELDP